MSNACHVCKSSLNKRTAPGLQCAGICQKFFHASCAGVSKEILASFALQNVDWFCNSCKKKKRTSMIIQDASTPTPEAGHSTQFFKSGGAELASISNFMSEIRAEFADFKNKQNEMLASISFISDSYDDILSKLNQVDEKFEIIEQVQRENTTLKKQLREQAARITMLEQSTLKNQLEIRGVPDNVDMSPIDIVKCIAAKINFTLNVNDVNFCKRTVWAAKDKPKDIVVCFNSIEKKDAFISQKKKTVVTTEIFVSINSSGSSSTSTSTPIYINESLCSSNKKLLYNVKLFAKNNNYKFVWVRDGNIQIRKNERSRFIIIKDLDTLNELDQNN